jgi:hypothetical protein
MPNDFPFTRRMLVAIEEWFIPLVQPFPIKQTRVKAVGEKDFYWDFEEHSVKTVMLGKAVRIITGLRAAMILADRGYITECGTILRTIDDGVAEIVFLIQGNKKPSEEYQKFIRQYFEWMPENPNELTSKKSEGFVKRREILSGIVEEMKGVEKNTDKVRKTMTFIAYGYDKYVHHGYRTSMELYSGKTKQFMLRGHDGPAERDLCKRMVASRLHSSFGALARIAEFLGNQQAMRNLASDGMALYQSGELA